MADEVIEQGNTVADAANAIQALLAGGTDQTLEQPKPESEPNPQPVAEAAPVEETPISEEAQAPAEVTAPEPTPEPPKPQPVPQSSLELDAKLQAAAKVEQEAAAARDKALAIINNIVPQLEAQLSGDFGDIKTQADVLNLMKNDPARYNDWAVRQQQLQFARTMQMQTHAEALKARADAEGARLGKLIPELTDKAKGEELANKLKAFATEMGITPERQANWTADDVVLIHRAMLDRNKVAAYEAEKAANAKQLEEAKQKAAKAPPVQKPGAARSETSRDDAVKADFDRLKKSGRTDDAADVFRHLIN